MDISERAAINLDPEILGGEPVFIGHACPGQNARRLARWWCLHRRIPRQFPVGARNQAVPFIEESGQLMLERHGTPAA